MITKDNVAIRQFVNYKEVYQLDVISILNKNSIYKWILSYPSNNLQLCFTYILPLVSEFHMPLSVNLRRHSAIFDKLRK